MGWSCSGRDRGARRVLDAVRSGALDLRPASRRRAPRTGWARTNSAAMSSAGSWSARRSAVASARCVAGDQRCWRHGARSVLTAASCAAGRSRHDGLHRRPAGLPRHPAGPGAASRSSGEPHAASSRRSAIAYTPVGHARRRARGVLSLREREFVEASRVMGDSRTVTRCSAMCCPTALRPSMVLATSPVRLGGARGKRAELPGSRRAAAGADLGQHAGRRPAVHGPASWLAICAGPVHHADAAGRQPVGRRAAGLARSQMSAQ